MATKEMVSVAYAKLADDSELMAQEAGAELSGVHVMCKVLRHRVYTQVDYLVEFSDGTRRWVREYEGD